MTANEQIIAEIKEEMARAATQEEYDDLAAELEWWEDGASYVPTDSTAAAQAGSLGDL